jgi:hypothetical protein
MINDPTGWDIAINQIALAVYFVIVIALSRWIGWKLTLVAGFLIGVVYAVFMTSHSPNDQRLLPNIAWLAEAGLMTAFFTLIPLGIAALFGKVRSAL